MILFQEYLEELAYIWVGCGRNGKLLRDRLGSEACRALFGMAYDHGVGVSGYYPHRVRQELVLGDGGALCGSRFTTPPPSLFVAVSKDMRFLGRGLEEEESQDLARHHGILFLISEMIMVARIMHINLD